MNPTELTDQELAELYNPWVVKFIKKHGREPTGIDSLRHHRDYMMAKGNEVDISDLQILSRLFHSAVDELSGDTPADAYVGNCSTLINHMLSMLRLIKKQSDKMGNE